MAKKSSGPDLVKELKNDLTAGRPGHLYVFHGEETYLRDHYIQRLRDTVCGGMEDWNLRRFDGAACTAEALSEAINGYPAFGGGVLVLVRDYDILRPEEKVASVMEDLFPSLPDYTTLVFVYDTIEYKPGKGAAAKLLNTYGKIIEFSRPDPRALAKWIIGHFEALGKHCDVKTAEYLIYLCGGLMTNLHPEIEKIGHYAAGEVITNSDIDAVATPTVEAVVFDLTDAAAARKTGRALMILGDLLTMKEEPVVILALLARSLRQLYATRLLQDAGRANSDTVMEETGVRYPFLARKLLDFASGTTSARLRRAVIACAEADAALKSSAGDKRLILETLLYRITGSEAEA